MKFKLFLKNTHIDMLLNLGKKYNIHNKEEIIKNTVILKVNYLLGN